MSSSLHVYLVDVAAVHAMIGSRDDDVLGDIRINFGYDMKADDEYFDHEIENGAPTADEALQAVVNGGPFSERRSHSFAYANAYQRLCSSTGSFLPNDHFTPHRGAWLSAVDQGLKGLGVTAVALTDFFGPMPAPLPRTDTVSAGVWTHERILQALEQLADAQRAVDEGRIPRPEPVGDDVAEAVQQSLGWMRLAADHPGYGTIGFHA
ncbi:hypothetical protein ACGH2B_24025 [Streptomyces sp. BBFR2]|uniref:DUF7691 family protein n=1 Tax=Streptomyces sp. BBFR2 TaxID=3372854 RepID=UPI0037D9E461